MTRYRVLPYKQGSASAKALAEALGGKVLKLEGSKFKPKPDDVIINWGNTTFNGNITFNDQNNWGDDYNLLNDGDLIYCVSNKLVFFEDMNSRCPGLTPKFWTNKEEIPDDEYPIVCRTILSGHSGDGIVIATSPDNLAVAKLYVKYEKKKDEYRVHCTKTTQPEPSITIIAVQRKARRTGAENVNWQVRNHANGFIYRRSDIHPPSRVLDVARQAFELSGLDFGAVDVIWNTQKEQAYVLEINTAPGLEGQTITDYANFFSGLS